MHALCSSKARSVRSLYSTVRQSLQTVKGLKTTCIITNTNICPVCYERLWLGHLYSPIFITQGNAEYKTLTVLYHQSYVVVAAHVYIFTTGGRMLPASE